MFSDSVFDGDGWMCGWVRVDVWLWLCESPYSHTPSHSHPSTHQYTVACSAMNYDKILLLEQTEPISINCFFCLLSDSVQ